MLRWPWRSITSGPDRKTEPSGGPYDYDVPLDPQSPWPKFKRDSGQTGRSPTVASSARGALWEKKTELGVFSSAVIDGDENVYIGSGDHVMYCFAASGEEKWRFPTGEIIDSSALLDDRGRLYVASCDGWVYALERTSGRLEWKTRCDAVEECRARNVRSLVDWFEAHIAITADGTLIVPNDNFHTYALDRETGRRKWSFVTEDQTWSLPAYNAQTNTLFMGNNYFALKNVFAIDAGDGESRWRAGTWGSVVASPLLTSSEPDGLVIVAGFDGVVRALRQRDGGQEWTFSARDHLYASPVQAADGTIIQAGADGTVYALEPKAGRLRWAFDTLEPIRSTPAIDGAGRIYFGNGEGKLYCISAQGEFLWSYRCITDERSDLNGSPAISAAAVVVGGDDGTIMRIPLDYPDTEAGRADPRCQTHGDDTGFDEGAHLYMTSLYGKTMASAPETIRAHDPLTLVLAVRRGGRRLDASLEPGSVSVEVRAGSRSEPTPEPKVVVSADRQFMTIIPGAPWADVAGGTCVVEISGRARLNVFRFGLKRLGGWRTRRFHEAFTLRVQRRHGSVSHPFVVANGPGRPCSVLEVGRLAPALPTILPSYNQLGFDSIHYHLGFVEGDARSAIVWGVGARVLGGGRERSVVDPSQRIRFVMRFSWDRGLLTLTSIDGFTLEFNGWDMPFESLRFTSHEVDTCPPGSEDPAEGLAPAALDAAVRCDEIDFYGRFLKLLGVSDLWTGFMHISGAAGRVRHLGTQHFDSRTLGIESVGFARVGDSISASIRSTQQGGPLADEHNFGLLLLCARDGQPLPAEYTKATNVVRGPAGEVRQVIVQLPRSNRPDRVRAYLMVDTSPLAEDTVTL